MDVKRAQKIAESFSRIGSFAVEQTKRGPLVHYLGKHAYFIREACFWPFSFNPGPACHKAGEGRRN